MANKKSVKAKRPGRKREPRTALFIRMTPTLYSAIEKRAVEERSNMTAVVCGIVALELGVPYEPPVGGAGVITRTAEVKRMLA